MTDGPVTTTDLMQGSGPRDHVLRTPLPWRNDRMTECGRPTDDVASFIDTTELAARVKRFGQQRTAFTVCMTCLGRVRYADTWEKHPIGVMYRELQRVGVHPGRSLQRNADAARMNGEAYLHRSRVPLEIAPINRVTASEWRDRQITIFDELAEYGDPDGCSPYGCRSGLPLGGAA
ncbi:hypothetical protein [Nocardia wallacei]|uniref:hypothetical protein n=1 Tax=Nocardia wallacei TaxID=480035 RepID=UPI0024540AFE|nr:hypothetical protein [Nocardia wallacei]